MSEQVVRHRERVMDQDTKVFISVAGSTTLEPYQTYVQLDLSGTDTHTITLAPVGLCKGQTVTIFAVTDGGGVSIQDNDDSEGWTNLGPTNADGEYVVLYCDGVRYNNVASNI